MSHEAFPSWQKLRNSAKNLSERVGRSFSNDFVKTKPRLMFYNVLHRAFMRSLKSLEKFFWSVSIEK